MLSLGPVDNQVIMDAVKAASPEVMQGMTPLEILPQDRLYCQESHRQPIQLASNPVLTGVVVEDVRFPLEAGFGRDVKNDTFTHYANAFVRIQTNQPGLEGVGFSFNLGNGNEKVCEAATILWNHLVKGGTTLQQIFDDFAGFHRQLKQKGPEGWFGPAGIHQQAIVAITNALIDLGAKVSEKSAGEWIGTLPPEQLVSLIDWHSLIAFMNDSVAVETLYGCRAGLSDRLTAVKNTGMPAYLTAGWAQYDIDFLLQLVDDAVRNGAINAVKLKVGCGVETDLEKVRLVRELVDSIRGGVEIMIDANQVLDVTEAIGLAHKLKDYDIYWFEEPVDQDSWVGHKALRQYINGWGIRVATGEAISNDTAAASFEIHGGWDVSQCDLARVTWPGHIAMKLLAYRRRRENALATGKAGGATAFCNHAGGTALNESSHQVAAAGYILGLDSLDGVWLEHVDPSGFGPHFFPREPMQNGLYLLQDRPGLVDITDAARRDFVFAA